MSDFREMTELPAFKQHDNTKVDIGNEPVRWSGATPPPPIGARVHVAMNAFGPATVVRYYTQHGFLGLVVRPDALPAWFKRQSPGTDLIHVFGAELKEEEA